jgi:hypothetical protein
MSMSKMAPQGNPELGWIPISMSGMELSKALSGIGLGMHKRAKGERFGGNVGKNVQRMSRDDVGEVIDDGNVVPGIRSLV